MPVHAIESAGSGDATVVVTGPCILTGVHMANINDTNRACIKFHDTASSPTAGTTTVTHRTVVPAAPSSTDVGGNNQEVHIEFANGLAYTITTEVTQAGSTGVTAGEVVGSLIYITGAN